MNNIKRWLICGVLFYVCFMILRYVDGIKTVEGYGGGGRGGGRGGGWRGHGWGGRGHGWGGRGGYYYGGYGRSYLDGYPSYVYDDFDYDDYPRRWHQRLLV